MAAPTGTIEGPPPGWRVVGLRRWDATHARSVIAAPRLVEKHLTQDQMFDSRQTIG